MNPQVDVLVNHEVIVEPEVEEPDGGEPPKLGEGLWLEALCDPPRDPGGREEHRYRGERAETMLAEVVVRVTVHRE